jgi:hypothetical protein
VVLLAVLLCTVSLAPLGATPVAGVSGTSGPSADAVSAATPRTTPQVDAPANESVNESEQLRHRDPRGLSEAGDLAGLERSLAELLASNLEESSVAISRGEYSRARSILGDRYDTVLKRYVRVTRETPERRDNTAQFRSTRDEQRAFVDTVRTYRERRTAYDEAKQTGDEREARELARELNRLAAEAEQRSERLSGEYDDLGEESDRDFSGTKRSLADIQQNIAAEQAVIREAEFVETSLTVTGVGGGGSFVDPVVVSGRLVDENGTLLANRSVAVAVNGTAVETETDDNATFSVPYRPVTDGLGRQNLTVAYVPRVDSIYLGSQSNTSAVIAQSVPTIAVADASSRASYGDRVVVSGSVAVESRQAAGVPLNVSVDGVVLGQVSSDDVGDFRFEGPLPATVDSGAQELSVAFPYENRALALNRTAVPLAVDTTRTEMTVDGRQAALESLAVAGLLRTGDGRPIANQSVTVFVAGHQSATVPTSETGLFATSVWLPSSTAGASETTVVAVFDGSETNLASSRATARVPIVTAGSQSSGGGVGGGEGGGGGAGTGTGGGGGDGGGAGAGGVGGAGGAGGGGGSGVGGGDSLGGASDAVGRALVGLAGPFAAAELFGVSVGGFTMSVWFDAVLAIVGLVVPIGLVVVVLRWRRRGKGRERGGTGTQSALVTAVEAVELPSLLLDLARDRVASGDLRLGVEYAYLGARLELAARLGLRNRGTHRRFAAACASRLPTADGERFAALTERYEQALFGSGALLDDEANCAVTEARRLVERSPDEARPITADPTDEREPGPPLTRGVDSSLD